MDNHKKMTILSKSFGIMFLFFIMGLVSLGLPHSYSLKLLEVIPEKFYSLGIAFLSGLSLIHYVNLIFRTSQIHRYLIRLILVIGSLLFSVITLLVTFRLLFSQEDDLIGVIFLGFSSLVFCIYLIPRAAQIHQQFTRILLLIGLAILGIVILLIVAFSTSSILVSADRSFFASDTLVLVWLAAITGLITAISGFLSQLTARKKMILEIELEKQKLALEREKFDLEKSKLSQKKRR